MDFMDQIASNLKVPADMVGSNIMSANSTDAQNYENADRLATFVRRPSAVASVPSSMMNFSNQNKKADFSGFIEDSGYEDVEAEIEIGQALKRRPAYKQILGKGY